MSLQRVSPSRVRTGAVTAQASVCLHPAAAPPGAGLLAGVGCQQALWAPV